MFTGSASNNIIPCFNTIKMSETVSKFFIKFMFIGGFRGDISL